jgi:DNA-binding response OmpR family regulator
MKNIDVLLASADRRAGNLIEVQVRDLCYGHEVVNCHRGMGVDDLLRDGSVPGMDLIILTPDSLIPSSTQPRLYASMSMVTKAIRTLKERYATPIIAVGVQSKHQAELLDAGVDCVLGLRINPEELRPAISQALNLHEWVREAEPTPARVPFAGLVELLTRGFQRFGQTS